MRLSEFLPENVEFCNYRTQPNWREFKGYSFWVSSDILCFIPGSDRTITQLSTLFPDMLLCPPFVCPLCDLGDTAGLILHVLHRWGRLSIYHWKKSHERNIFRPQWKKMFTSRSVVSLFMFNHVTDNLAFCYAVRISEANFIFFILIWGNLFFSLLLEKEGEKHQCERETLIGCLPNNQVLGL